MNLKQGSNSFSFAFLRKKTVWMSVGKQITESWLRQKAEGDRVGGELENSLRHLSFTVFVIESLVESLPNQPPNVHWTREGGEDGNFWFFNFYWGIKRYKVCKTLYFEMHSLMYLYIMYIMYILTHYPPRSRQRMLLVPLMPLPNQYLIN